MVFDNYTHFEQNNFWSEKRRCKSITKNIHHLVTLTILTSRYWASKNLCISIDMHYVFPLDIRGDGLHEWLYDWGNPW